MSRFISAYQIYGVYSPPSDARLRTHLFKEGEDIDGLADLYYGDRRLWELIADRNGIEDARKIAPGTILLIPEAELEDGLFESE
jgi:nucleoid-associated protein YgaU